MTRSPPGPHASPNQSGGNNSYNSATWERTLRMNSSSSLGKNIFTKKKMQNDFTFFSSNFTVVPPPLGSAPPPSTAALSPQHKPVRASLSSLSSSQLMNQLPETSSTNMVMSNSNPGLDESWYRSNKIATAKTLQLQRQLSAGSFQTGGMYQSMKMLRFFSHSDFTWNQICRIWSCKRTFFAIIGRGLSGKFQKCTTS